MTGKLFAKFGSGIKRKAAACKCELSALVIAYRDPRTPWHAKAFSALVLAYALSPIDLIPDFIPVLGYLDDLVLIPLGVILAIKMIPGQVWTESRKMAQAQMEQRLPRSRRGIVIVLAIWLIGLVAAAGIFGLCFPFSG